LPANNANTYGAYDPTRARGELIGHTDAVWDLTLARDENTLVSCGAEGAVKVWDVSGPSGGGALALTWGFAGLDAEDSADPATEGEDGAPGCTAIEAIKTDIRKVAVAYASAVIKIFEIDTGRETARITSEGDEGSAATQINRMASHPTMPLLVTGHEDKHIRIFDITTGIFNLFLLFGPVD
jgi:striatin 1/3/4